MGDDELLKLSKPSDIEGISAVRKVTEHLPSRVSSRIGTGSSALGSAKRTVAESTSTHAIASPLPTLPAPTIKVPTAQISRPVLEAFLNRYREVRSP